MKRDYFLAIAGAAWALGAVLAVVIINNALDVRVKKAEVAAYQQGWKDALYKRPVSNDLELVCAGLWVGEQNKKYQQLEAKRGH